MALVGSFAGFGLGSDPALAAPLLIIPAPKAAAPRPRPRPLGKSHGSARPSTSPGPLGTGATSGMMFTLNAASKADEFGTVGGEGEGVKRRPSLFKRHRPFSLFGSEGEKKSDSSFQEGRSEDGGENHRSASPDGDEGTRTPVPAGSVPALTQGPRRARATTIVASSSPVSLRRSGTVVVASSRARSPFDEERRSSWIRPAAARRPSAGTTTGVVGGGLVVGAHGQLLVAEIDDPQPRCPTPYPGQRPRSRKHSRIKSRPTSSSGTSSSGASGSTSSGGTTVGGSLTTRIGALFHFSSKSRRGSAWAAGPGRERGATFGGSEREFEDDLVDDEGNADRGHRRQEEQGLSMSPLSSQIVIVAAARARGFSDGGVGRRALGSEEGENENDDDGQDGAGNGGIFHAPGSAPKLQCQIDVDNAQPPSLPSPPPCITASSPSPPSSSPLSPLLFLLPPGPPTPSTGRFVELLPPPFQASDSPPACVQPSCPHIDLQSASPTRSPNLSPDNVNTGIDYFHDAVFQDTTTRAEDETSAGEEERDLVKGPPLSRRSPRNPVLENTDLSFVPSSTEHEEVAVDLHDPLLPPVLPSPPQPPLDLDEEESADELLLTPPTMLSSTHQSSVSTNGHPPYPYAHLYPQPQASSSGHRHSPQQPHSHHGHGREGISYLSQRSGAGSPPRGPYAAAGTGAEGNSRSGMRLMGGSKVPRAEIQAQQQQQQGQATKAHLKAWWNQFNFVRGMKKDVREEAPDNVASGQNVVFGRPLKESLKYASVQISTADASGELYVWGFIPVVVAKCGLYLKENATEVPGTFRVNGSNRRMRELQAVFETPPRYGKNLDWKQESYTTHDVASVFRRYLTQMPEPVIPHDLYHQFRDVLVQEPFNQDEVIAKYKSLIRQMPRANQYLLLYVLDLLSVFARKSDKNLMTASNLAVIFRPGLMSHPEHEMQPQEHALSQRVLEFLIAHQDWFMLDIPPPSNAPGAGTRRGSAAQVPTTPGAQPTSTTPFTSPPQPYATPPQHERRPSDSAVAMGQPPPLAPSGAAYGGGGSAPTSPSRNQSFQQQQESAMAVSGGTSPRVNHHVSGGVAAGAAVGAVGASSLSTAVQPHAPGHNAPPSAFRGTASSPSDAGQEEHSEIGGGDWKLVSKGVDAAGFAVNGAAVVDVGGNKMERERKVIRRRTTVERSDRMKQGSKLDEGDLSPQHTHHDSGRLSSMISASTGATVQRSRTLPSSSQRQRQKENLSSRSAENAVVGNTGGAELGLTASSSTRASGGSSGFQPHPNNASGVSVQFANGTNGDGAAAARGGKEKRSVLVKKSRRASAAGEGQQQQQRTLF